MHGNGPALIVAGPGSGKTHILTHHIKHLIENGVSPDSIIVITFTKFAASSMKSRFYEIMPRSAKSPVFGTFHSIFLKFLQSAYGNKIKVLSSDERFKLIRQISTDEENTEVLSDRISLYKSQINKDSFFFKDESDRLQFLDKLDKYSRLCKLMNAYDFDDIIERFYHLLCNDKSYCNKLRRFYKYICIDEFQDINSIQYECVKIMSDVSHNIFCVGDEDQSIYGFRGAHPGIMKRFLLEFPDAKIINLCNNYRSYSDIVSCAEKVIEENSDRIRNVKASCVRVDNTSHFNLVLSKSKSESTNQLITDIKKNITKGFECAVLFRTNREVLEFVRKFNESFHNDSLYYSLLYIFLDYLKVILHSDYQAFCNIVNIPNRNVPFIKQCKSMDAFFNRSHNNMTACILSTLKSQLSILEKLQPFSFVMYMLKIIGIENYLIKETGATMEEVQKISLTLIRVSTECNSLQELEELLINITKKNNDISLVTDDYGEKLKILTYHRSKGLEFDVVFLPNVYEGRVPIPNSVIDCNIEEERRLFYVAMTRAKNYLYVYSIKNEESNSVLSSRFLKPLMNN